MDDFDVMDMDMDMEMDPEELELLESTYRTYEQQPDDDAHYFYNPPEDEPEPEPEQQSPPTDLANSHKRSRSNSNSDLDLDSSDVEKREKVRVRVAEDSHAEEEDWLRPPPTSEVTVEEVRFSKDKRLSRFASEIDGEVMPVTAPNGDRVYTKLDRYYGEDRVTKLNCRGDSSGIVLFDKLTSVIQFLHNFNINWFHFWRS